MPLKPRFESFDRPGYIKKYLQVEQGGAGYIEDKSIGGFVITRCLSPDTGGLVFTSDEAVSVEGGPLIIACSPLDLAEEILMGLDCKIEIVNEDDEYGLLIIQHEMPNGQINSLN